MPPQAHHGSQITARRLCVPEMLLQQHLYLLVFRAAHMQFTMTTRSRSSSHMQGIASCTGIPRFQTCNETFNINHDLVFPDSCGTRTTVAAKLQDSSQKPGQGAATAWPGIPRTASVTLTGYQSFNTAAKKLDRMLRRHELASSDSFCDADRLTELQHCSQRS